ncbi:MAG: glutamate racemase [Bacteroidales bacterium]|nr:glutamate racemase [Bacteroidales bacterium]
MAKIGIFDSGAGGLSVFREIRKVLPDEDYIYYSDSANCPYGEKPMEFIIDRCRNITDMLISEGAEIIVVACNTATAAAIRTLREEYSIKFIGMEPAIKPAAQFTKTGTVGVLATAGTLKSEKYLKHKEKYASDIRIIEHVGDGFVELVEKGIISGPEAESIVRKSLEPLLDAGADTIVLGCTHYPFLSDVIIGLAGPEIRLIDPAPAIAKHLIEVMDEEGITYGSADSKSSHIDLRTSGDPDILEKIFRQL